MSIRWLSNGRVKRPDDNILIDVLREDENLVRTAGLHLVQGRDMDLSHYPSDSTAALLNESAVRTMGFTNPFGQTIAQAGDAYHVIGVVKDFISGSPYDKIGPMVIEGAKTRNFDVINVRLAAPMMAGIDKMRKLFIRYNPDYPFEYHFTSDDYALKFRDTRQIATLAGLFAGLTIFISCLGLFGLAAFMAEARIREIGIRKVTERNEGYEREGAWQSSSDEVLERRYSA
jgi:putative ABC transport system permease protein